MKTLENQDKQKIYGKTLIDFLNYEVI